MSIAKKKITKQQSAPSARTATPHLSCKAVGINKGKLEALHRLIEERKVIEDGFKSDPTKKALLEQARDAIFSNRSGSFYVDLNDGKSLLVKPNSRRYALTEDHAEKIEDIIETAGYDAGDYYHESQAITMDADSIYGRVSEEGYGKFQSDLAEFMADRGLGDCWEMTSSIIAKPDFPVARHGLPVDVNMAIEKVKPMPIGVEAKRSI
jgi:hypothetical protein